MVKMKDKSIKTFTVSPVQANLLVFIQQHQQAIFAAILSNMAYDMGYKVTEDTQFELSNDFKELKITEVTPSLEDVIVKSTK